LKLAVEVGLLGTALYAAMLLAIAAAVWRARRLRALRPYATTVSVTIVVLLVLSTVDNVKDYNAVFYVLFALAGAMVGLAHRRGTAAAAVRARARRTRRGDAYAALRLARQPGAAEA
jgi:O-antigen ligase